MGPSPRATLLYGHFVKGIEAEEEEAINELMWGEDSEDWLGMHRFMHVNEAIVGVEIKRETHHVAAPIDDEDILSAKRVYQANDAREIITEHIDEEKFNDDDPQFYIGLDRF